MLGDISYFYMLTLIILLIIGFGMIILKLFNYIFNLNLSLFYNKNFTRNTENVKLWAKISLLCFISIVILTMLLAIINPNILTVGSYKLIFRL